MTHFLQWKRIKLTEPRSSFTNSIDGNLPSGAKDAASEFEAKANQNIVDKYRMLRALKQKINHFKREFNKTALQLQEEKREQSLLLSNKIEKFRGILNKLHCDDGDVIHIDERTEQVIQFDGKSFKVTLKLHCKPISFVLQSNLIHVCPRNH